MTDEELLHRCAREIVVKRGDDTIFLTRYTNHGGLISGGRWWAMIPADGQTARCAGGTPNNPWYLSGDGHWRYKSGQTFESLQALLDFLPRAHTLRESYEVAP